MSKAIKKNIPHFHGHRQRVKEKFLNLSSSAKESVQCYEILEALLFFTNKRKDVKSVAKDIVREFKSLNNFLSMDIDNLKNIKGVGKMTKAYFNMINEVNKRSLVNDKTKQRYFSTWISVLNYLKDNLKPVEQVELQIIFLNNRLSLVGKEIITGDLIYEIIDLSRRIISYAIDVSATNVILIYNTPSEDIDYPTRTEIKNVTIIRDILKNVEIYLIDYFIFTIDKKYFSFYVKKLI